MENIELIVFDLDGTLVRSHKTIYQATIKAFEDLGIQDKLDEDEFYNMIGMHFQDIFDEFEIHVNDFDHFIEVYKYHYNILMNTSELYPGVAETLNHLKKKEYKIALLTTKGQDQAEKIISHFNLDSYFDEIHGRRPELPIKPNPEPLLLICNNLKVKPENTLMVGDSELDVNCAHNAKTKSCAAAYGYRTKERLQTEQPDIVIDSINELLTVINKNGESK